MSSPLIVIMTLFVNICEKIKVFRRRKIIV